MMCSHILSSFRLFSHSRTGAYDRQSVDYIINSQEGRKYYHFFKHMLLGTLLFFLKFAFMLYSVHSCVHSLFALSCYNIIYTIIIITILHITISLFHTGSEEHYYVSLLYNWPRTRAFVQSLSAQIVWNTWELGLWEQQQGFQTHTHFLSLNEIDILAGKHCVCYM